jgi:phenylacetic acid degradation operon negative regulatory protein
MTAKTELLLYRMLWLTSKAIRPTYRNIEESFEGWAYASGLLAQIQRLESKGYLESLLDTRTGKRLHRLTEAGRKAAAGPRDPESAWAARWDGKWRIIVFDIPETHRSERRKLTRALAGAGCGCIQGSTWISASTPPEINKIAQSDDPECSRLMMLLAESKGARMDQNMVKAAWDFEAINQLYHDHLDHLASFRNLKKSTTREDLDDWTARENAAWRKAIAADPLLPDKLLPSGYLGKKSLHHRRETLPMVAELVGRIWPRSTG